ncbi:nitrate/nitrite transporter [Brevibacterium yomogidense]|uniref:nitrate/nitrite transporter n=1 Tax=Brevibacterium yomogidense TaxID=946573 RepID=UPI001E3FB9DB|nr:NarK/NasA family nitrate transporter [Brevibacterium yomogidense]
MPDAATTDRRQTGETALRTTALVMATLGFAVNFWAWSLLSPLGPVFVTEGIADDAALIVAVPVLVGSLGRIVVGALTDRFGGRLMMPAVSLISVVPVLFIGFVGQYTLTTLIVGGFVLGVAGTSFAVGVPYVNAWFPKEKRGSAIGIYGAGMGGTAIAAFTTVPLFEVGDVVPFLAAAAALIVYAVAALLLMKDPPGWSPSRKHLGAQLAETARIRLTWQTCYLYALSFGGYVAFSVYLPSYLMNAYQLEAHDAAMRMAGFVVAAVLMRPVGGMLSDRIGPVRTLIIAYTAVTVCAVCLVFDPPLMPVGTIAFIGMSMGLGMGAGGVFALIGGASDPAKVGSITGFVGAAGGLGGFIPPLLLGILWRLHGDYSLGIVFLALATVIALLITVWVGREAQQTSQNDPSSQEDPS